MRKDHLQGIPMREAFGRCADFFAARERGTALVRDLAEEEHSPREWALQYDYLFRGTDADADMPLWASLALEERVLWNQTTLDVIRFYHRYGYAPVGMEGNPPDYIGEQFGFLAYLAATADPDCEECVRTTASAAEEFVQSYTLNTAQQLWKAVRDYSGVYAGYVNILEEMVRLLSEEDFGERLAAELRAADPSKCEPRNPAIPDQEERTINTAGINNCGGICVIKPTVQEGCMLSISTDSSKNAPQLRACVRGRSYRKTFLNSGRLRYPMKRVGERGSGKFERITWEEAVDLLSSEWIRIRDTYGPAARFPIYGTGVCGTASPAFLAMRLLAQDGGFLGGFNSYSSACVTYMDTYVFGTADGAHSAADLLNTKLLILWADNTTETIFGPERNYYLSQLKKKGVRIICIDPRLSQTGVAYADEWFAIKPSTDAALADAMAYVIWSEGLQDQEFMDRYCLGFDEEHMPEGVPAGESYHSYLFGLKDGIVKTPEWAEPITGIEADRIRALARLYATTKPACISAGLGAQRHGNGEQAAKGIHTLSCLTGNLGRSGGGVGGNPSKLHEHRDIWMYTNKAPNPYPGSIPNFLWTKAVEKGTEMTPRGDRLKGVEKLDTNIKMILCLASDTLINQHSNVNDTIRILKDTSLCEFIVCSDIFMTPSARYSDLILPATSVFEGENMIHSWAGSNYFLKNNKVIDPIFGCRFEWDWLKEVAERLGLYEKYTEGKPEIRQWLKENYEIVRSSEPELPTYEQFSEEGGWQFKEPVLWIPFAKEIADPEKHPFPTPSGKVEIFSKRLYDEFGDDPEIPAIPMYIPAHNGPEDEKRKTYPLQMIGWHTRRRCHSIHDNNEWQDEIEMPGLWIHPEDAAPRGIADGDTIEVFNENGTVRVPAIVTTRICRGVTAMSQGGWYTPDKDGVDIRGCINVLTGTEKPTPLAKGNPQHTNLVEVRRVGDRFQPAKN